MRKKRRIVHFFNHISFSKMAEGEDIFVDFIQSKYEITCIAEFKYSHKYHIIPGRMMILSSVAEAKAERMINEAREEVQTGKAGDPEQWEYGDGDQSPLVPYTVEAKTLFRLFSEVGIQKFRVGANIYHILLEFWLLSKINLTFCTEPENMACTWFGEICS